MVFLENSSWVVFPTDFLSLTEIINLPQITQIKKIFLLRGKTI